MEKPITGIKWQFGRQDAIQSINRREVNLLGSTNGISLTSLYKILSSALVTGIIKIKLRSLNISKTSLTYKNTYYLLVVLLCTPIARYNFFILGQKLVCNFIKDQWHQKLRMLFILTPNVKGMEWTL